jgi:Protein of Unknown function (DUF2784)
MPYGLLADAVVAVHAAFVGFVVFGQLLVLAGVVRGWAWVRNPWFRTAHLLCIGYVALEAAAGVTCPLTTWEHELRTLAGQPVPDASFVGRLFHNLLFVNVGESFLPWFHMGFGLLVLVTFVLAPPRLPWPRALPARQSAVSR